MKEAIEFTKRMLAHQVYRDEDDKIVPSVTTILSVLNKPALVKWANNLGLEGIDSNKYVDKMAGIGTLAHTLIEYHLKEIKPDLSEYSSDDITKAQVAVSKYLEWEKGKKLELILTEEQLVSEKLGFGGTIDLYAKLDNQLCLIDFKTSKAIYPEMMYQLAAYKFLLIENGYDIQRVMILRVGRNEKEGFEVKQAGELKDEWLIFLHCLGIYKLKQKLK